jgi:hypothetical protein
MGTVEAVLAVVSILAALAVIGALAVMPAGLQVSDHLVVAVERRGRCQPAQWPRRRCGCRRFATSPPRDADPASRALTRPRAMRVAPGVTTAYLVALTHQGRQHREHAVRLPRQRSHQNQARRPAVRQLPADPGRPERRR